MRIQVQIINTIMTMLLRISDNINNSAVICGCPFYTLVLAELLYSTICNINYQMSF